MARTDGKTIFISNAAYRRLKRMARKIGKTLKETVDRISREPLIP